MAVGCGSTSAMSSQGLEVEAVASEIAEATMPTVQRVAALEAEIRCFGRRQEEVRTILASVHGAAAQREDSRSTLTSRMRHRAALRVCMLRLVTALHFSM